jgi:hypothetical protein
MSDPILKEKSPVSPISVVAYEIEETEHMTCPCDGIRAGEVDE